MLFQHGWCIICLVRGRILTVCSLQKGFIFVVETNVFQFAVFDILQIVTVQFQPQDNCHEVLYYTQKRRPDDELFGEGHCRPPQWNSMRQMRAEHRFAF